MLELASHIVETKSGHFNPEEFEDHYEDALKELLKKKQAGEKIEAPSESHQSDGCPAPKRGRGAWRANKATSPIRQGARRRIRTSKEEKVALVGKSAFDQPQYRPPLYWWRLRWMFVGQHSNGLPEFIQQDGRIDLCGCDTLTSISGLGAKVIHGQCAGQPTSMAPLPTRRFWPRPRLMLSAFL